jgi:hypothetical protein
MITVSVGPDEKKFAVHKDALATITKDFFRVMHSLETDPEVLHQFDLPGEQVETFGAFLKWLYAAYSCGTFSSLPSSTLSPFQLYAFAYKYLIKVLEDTIVSIFHKKFAHDDDLWHILGSEKPALGILLKEVPSDTHLYRLVVRSLAYSMRFEAECHWPESENSWRYSALPSRPATEDQVREVMNSVPSELWGPISKVQRDLAREDAEYLESGLFQHCRTRVQILQAE